ncbi:MAG: uncharacterized protein JWM82_1845, partial [Myxococcales bacterium]|nr:uncharacterized protein [Myxococcales bacterium]
VATDLAPDVGGVDLTAVDAADAVGAADVALFPSDAGALLPERYRALAVTAGSYHTCALLDDHRVKCWGNNTYGQLGTGDTNERRGAPEEMGDHLPTVDLGTGRTAKAISAGRYATCAILDDDSVKCWGWSPQAFGSDRVSGDDTFIGDEPSELGDALPRVALGAGRTARLLAVGFYSACVVKDDESTHCWGSTIGARDLPASPSRRVTRLFGASGAVALFDDGVAQTLIDSDVVPAPPRDAGRAVVVAGSRSRACVLWANGQSRCGSDANRWWPAALPMPVQAGENETSYFFCGILADGHVVCPTARDAVWNDLSSSGGPFVRLGQPAVSLTSGSFFHFCAALLNVEVKCWSADGSTPEAMGMGGSVPTATTWPSVDLGTRH